MLFPVSYFYVSNKRQWQFLNINHDRYDVVQLRWRCFNPLTHNGKCTVSVTTATLSHGIMQGWIADLLADWLAGWACQIVRRVYSLRKLQKAQLQPWRNRTHLITCLPAQPAHTIQSTARFSVSISVSTFPPPHFKTILSQSYTIVLMSLVSF